MSETSPKLRAELEGIPTYKPGKPAAAGAVAYKLSSNENPYPPLPGVMETVTAAASSFNRYPDMMCTGLMNELSERFGVPLSHLATGTGSVGVAQQLIQATAGPGRGTAPARPASRPCPSGCWGCRQRSVWCGR